MDSLSIIASVLGALMGVGLVIEYRRGRKPESCRDGHKPEVVDIRPIEDALPLPSTIVLFRCVRCGDFKTVVHAGLWTLGNFQQPTQSKEIADLERMYRAKEK